MTILRPGEARSLICVENYTSGLVDVNNEISVDLTSLWADSPNPSLPIESQAIR